MKESVLPYHCRFRKKTSPVTWENHSREEAGPFPHPLRYVPVNCPVPRTCPSMAFRSEAASTVPEEYSQEDLLLFPQNSHYTER